MGFLDALRNIKRPAAGTPAQSAEAVKAGLLALNSEKSPFMIRDGSAEGADLVAEWKIALPHWHTVFSAVDTTNRTLMRLDIERQELRSVDQEFRVTWVNGIPRFALSKSAARGQINKVEYKATLGRNEEGKLTLQREASFSAKELKKPVQDTVTGLGWAWRGVSFGKL